MFVYTLFGWVFFMYDLEGFGVLTSIGQAYYEMIILNTTSNFPNVMMPAYNDQAIYAIYFIVYLVIGLFILQNILLANVYI